MITVWRSEPSRRRISRVASKPSISGIWQSIKHRVVPDPAECSERADAVVRDVDDVAHLLEHAHGHSLIHRVVVDDEEPRTQVRCHLRE